MSPLDIFILILFVAAIAYGLKRGIIVQIGSVVGIIVGILACRIFGDQVTGYFCGADAEATSRYITAVFVYLCLFAIGFIATKIVARFLKVVTKALMLSIVDRLAGALFTVFEWFLIFSIILNVWQALTPDKNVVASSRMLDGRPAAAIMALAPTVLGSIHASSLFDSIDDAVTGAEDQP